MSERAARGTVVPEVKQADDRALYIRLYRQRRPEKAKLDRARTSARAAAALRVARRYPSEYARAFAQECKKRGIER